MTSTDAAPGDRHLHDLVSRVLDETWGISPPDDPKAIYHLPKTMGPEVMPKVFKRVKSAHGFLAAWKKLRIAVWMSKTIPYGKLPEFVYAWGKRLYDTSERDAYDAIMSGDVPFFEAWAHRFAIIDSAAQEAKMTIRERGTILYAGGVLQGYADAAAGQLKALGGPKTVRRATRGSR